MDSWKIYETYDGDDRFRDTVTRMKEECERLVLISENRQRKVKYGDGRQGII